MGIPISLVVQEISQDGTQGLVPRHWWESFQTKFQPPNQCMARRQLGVFGGIPGDGRKLILPEVGIGFFFVFAFVGLTDVRSIEGIVLALGIASCDRMD